MPDYLVAEELQTHLVANGIGILPADTATNQGVKPVVILEPRDGAPQPVGKFDSPAVITLRNVASGRPHDLDYAIEETFVDVVVRAKNNGNCQLIQRQIRGLLIPGDAVGGAKMVTIGAVLVEYLTQWRSDQPIGQDATSYDRVQSFRFGVRRKALQGLPYAP